MYTKSKFVFNELYLRKVLASDFADPHSSQVEKLETFSHPYTLTAHALEILSRWNLHRLNSNIRFPLVVEFRPHNKRRFRSPFQSIHFFFEFNDEPFQREESHCRWHRQLLSHWFESFAVFTQFSSRDWSEKCSVSSFEHHQKERSQFNHTQLGDRSWRHLPREETILSPWSTSLRDRFPTTLRRRIPSALEQRSADRWRQWNDAQFSSESSFVSVESNSWTGEGSGTSLEHRRDQGDREEVQKIFGVTHVLGTFGDYQSINPEENLPVSFHREKLLSIIENNSIIIGQGNTGSGKSNQIPQYILDGEHRRQWPIGYQTSLNKQRCELTRILYCTTGVLLQKWFQSFDNEDRMAE